MSPKPFSIIATAIAHSPNLEANIHESIRLKNSLAEKLILIHVGAKTAEDEEKFISIIKRAGGSTDEVELIWREGDPVDVILEIADDRDVELIIAGAMPREGLLRYYMGSIARRLVRAPKCNSSILLMTNPSKMKSVCGRIVVNGLDHPKTSDTIKKAVEVAGCLEARELVVVEEVEPSKIGARAEDDKSLAEVNLAKKRIGDQENKRINDILKNVEVSTELRVLQKCIFGKPGYVIGHYAETYCADLLIMNSPDTKLGFLDRVFTHHLEYILSELPCDLLIVNSKSKG